VKAVTNSPGSQVPDADPRQYVVPAVLRRALLVPWQAPGRREPVRVTPGAFTAAGLPVPEHPAQRNIYQLTPRQGLAWTPGLDAHIRRRGGELLGHGHLILVDIDSPAAADGRPLVNALRWLADRAVEAGGLLDMSAPHRCAPALPRKRAPARVAPVVPGRPRPPGAPGNAATPSNCAPGAPAPDHRGT
jgi:hypothetical protein